VDGDPLTEPRLLSDPGRIWLVLQLGVPVAGQALTNEAPTSPSPALTSDPGSGGYVTDAHPDQVGDRGGAGA
ncbi:MAG: hypothetical protein ACRDOD_10930, partial [Streptosporangiaceae bacterium]